VTVAGTVLGGRALRVDVETALRGYTITAAWAIHRERSVGSLEPGKLADLAILAADPTAGPVDRIGSIAVQETWLGGERVA
jgi:predicted amidohydrolase YtcJ